MSKRKRGFAAFAVLHFIVFAGLCLDRHQKSQRIIGRWRLNQDTLTFLPNGRMIATYDGDGGPREVETMYTFVGLNRIRLSVPVGVTVKADVHQDQLIFHWPDSRTDTWSRVKKQR